MKLEVEMYARTKEGKIFKINETNVVGKNYYLDIRETREIIKASYNIIDILEVGDYVNGYKVIDIVENDIYISDYYAESYIGIVKAKNIKTIVTKEQFEQMTYKVGE